MLGNRFKLQRGGVDGRSTKEPAAITSALSTGNWPAPLASSAQLGGRGGSGIPGHSSCSEGRERSDSSHHFARWQRHRISEQAERRARRGGGERGGGGVAGAEKDDVLQRLGIAGTKIRALTRGVRRGAAPRARCGSGTAGTGAIPARLNEGNKPSGHHKAPLCRSLVSECPLRSPWWIPGEFG